MIEWLIAGLVYSLIMYWLRFKCKLTDVQASAWLVLAAGVLVRVFDLDFAYGAIAACVSYALMSDERTLGPPWEYEAAASTACLVFALFNETLVGIGGRLGTFAFTAVLVWLGIKHAARSLLKAANS